MTVLDVMAKSPAVATMETAIGEIARMMAEQDCGAIPVVESKDAPKPIGIITDRDIVIRLVAEGKNPLDAQARDAMTNSVATVSPGMSLEVAANVMEQNQVRRVPVVDDNGNIIGIVSQADIALNAPEQTAELLREVSEDENLASGEPMSGSYSG